MMKTERKAADRKPAGKKAAAPRKTDEASRRTGSGRRMTETYEKEPKFEKETWKGGNMLYPLPVVLVSVGDGKDPDKDNMLTVAWAGTICSDPPMVSISVRPERYSYQTLMNTGEFVINLPTERMVQAVDYCGVKSGKDVNKWEKTGLHKIPADKVSAPMIGESSVNLECKVREKKKLGSHTMFTAEVVAVHADKTFMDAKHKFHLEWSKPIVYSHGTYYSLGKVLGTFGYSVKSKH